MSQEWYYSIDGEQTGPISPAELKKAATDGTLNPTDMVWKEGMAEWVEAKSIKGLFPAGAESTSRTREAQPEEEESPRKRAVSRTEEEDDYDDGPARSKNGKKVPKFNREEVKSKKMVAALLALFVGGYGIHKFYLGKSTAGIMHILACCGGLGVISLIECIIYFTKSEEDFYKDYIAGDKGWF